jgi:multiple sugar transport system permease protein
MAMASADLPARAAQVARRGFSKGTEQSHIGNILFVLPFVLVYTGLLVYPLIKGMVMSFQDFDMLVGEGFFIGWENYTRLFTDDIFLGAVRNTLVFVLLTMPAFVVIGLLLALALNNSYRRSTVFRALFFGSSVLSVTIVTLVWRMVFSPNNGLLNNIIGVFGIAPVSFLNNETMALPAIAIATVWWGIGLPMMLFLAALQQIPRDLYEAAALDNASRMRTLWSITLPSIRRTIVLVAVIEVILQFQLFGQAVLMTQGGPGNASRPIVQFIYEAGFRDWMLGYAAAASQILFVLMLVAAAVQLWLGRNRGQS